jgi:hypothetical protein
LNLANWKPVGQKLNESVHLIDLESTQDKQDKLKTLVQRYTSQGASGVWRVHRWWLAYFSLVVGDREDWNDDSGPWYDEWPLDTLVDSPTIQRLCNIFLLMLVDEPAEYPGHDNDKALNEVLVHKPESDESALPRAPPLQKVVLFCQLPGQVCHLKWWQTRWLADDSDIFCMYAEMGNDKHTKMRLKFQGSPNPSVFVTTPKVGGTGLNLTAANYAVIPQKFWELN